MGRLIDADKLRNVFLKSRSKTFDYSVVVKEIDYAPTVEAIPKANYETRLKADLKAMLVELQLEIEEMDSGCGWEGYRPTAQVIGLIQQKINTLKEQNNE